jgi:hypothetical protein
MEIKMLETPVHKLEPDQMGILFGNGTFVLLFTRMSGNADSQKMRERFTKASNEYPFISCFQMDADEHHELAAKMGIAEGSGYVVFEKGEIIYIHPGELSFDGLNSLMWHLQFRRINKITGDLILDEETAVSGSTDVIRKMDDENFPEFYAHNRLSVVLFTLSNPDEKMLGMEAVVESAASQFPSIRFCMVEADIMQLRAAQLFIKTIPTCIGFKNGQNSFSLTGAHSEEQFHEQLRIFLAETQMPES